MDEGGARDRLDVLYVLFTMDCEPAGGHPKVRGPASWERSETAIEGFVETLAEEGFLATLFVTSDAVRRNARALEKARACDAEIALLCHSHLLGFTNYIGGYSMDRQEEIIGTARDQWARETGSVPRTVRPGFFSMNDLSYQVLCLAGFRQGSCSIPGRIKTEECSDWRAGFPLAHHTDPLDRCAHGSLEFFEVPVSSDFGTEPTAGNDFTPNHLRLGDEAIEGWFEPLVRRHLERARGDDVEIATLVFTTDSAVAWGRPDDPNVDRLKRVLAVLRRMADAEGTRLVPVTVCGAHEEADRRWIDRFGPPDGGPPDGGPPDGGPPDGGPPGKD